MDDRVLGFVDVPGHERLVRNMLVGATGIDFVLLVVAADDGPMPQTREHLHILDLLGLTDGAVALTKVDLVRPEQAAAVTADIQALLRNTGLATAPIFPVSSQTAQGVGKLRSYLFGRATTKAPRAVCGYFRLAIDRCFVVLEGAGTIVTGTVFSGRIAVGEELILSPPGHAVRVRGIHAQDRPARQGHAGQRCALNLAGSGFDKSTARRGQWVLEAAVHAPTQRVDVELRLLEAESRVLQHWTSVHVHLGGTDVTGRVALLEDKQLEPGGCALAQIVLDAPIGSLAGDRFVLRDQSASRTMGGGVVLDPFAPARGRRKVARLTSLKAWAKLDPEAALRSALAACRSGVDLQRFSQAWNLRPEELRRVSARVPVHRISQPAGALGFAEESWRGLRATALRALDQEHERAPDMVGISRECWHRLTDPALTPATFSALVEDLRAPGLVCQTGCWLHRPEHQPRLTHDEAQLWAKVHPLLEEVAFCPPRVRDLARVLWIDEERVRRLLKHVARLGEIYPVAHDHYFTSRAVRELAHVVAELNRDAGAAKAAAFRDCIGTGRKLAIQILEFFDRTGYTRRVQDHHLISQPGLFDERPL